jgi:hypothetical protein
MSLIMRTGLFVLAVSVAVGLAVAVAFLPLLIALGVLVGLGVLGFRGEGATTRPSVDQLCGRERLAMGIGVAVVVAGYATIGMITLLGAGGATLVGATALAGFGLRGLRRGPARRDRRAARAGGLPENSTSRPVTTLAGPRGMSARRLLPSDPAVLSIDDLCRAWRISFLLLQKARGPDELEHAARIRRSYLDELARRHPEGFRRWLDDGARAADDPSSYVRHRYGPPERS